MDFQKTINLELSNNPKLAFQLALDKLEATEGHLVPVIIKAIQDLSAKVAALEAA